MKTLMILRQMTYLSVTFRYRRSRGENSTNGHIQVCIKIKDFSYAPLTYKHNIDKSVWDYLQAPKKGIAKDVQARAAELKKELDEFTNTIRATYEILYKQGYETITAHDLVYYNTKTTEQQKKKISVNNLPALLDDFLEVKKNDVIKEIISEKVKNKITEGTYRNYRKFIKRINEYLQHSKQRHLSIQNVDKVFLTGFERYLDKDNKPSYVAKIIKFLKQVLDYAVDCKYISINHLANVKTFNGQSEDPFNISEEDIQKIEKYEHYDSTERRYVNAWLLARELALHYIDYADLSNEHIIKRSFNELTKVNSRFQSDLKVIKKNQSVFTFEKKRVKTKIYQNSLFTPRAIRMFEYFNNNVLMLPLNKRYKSISCFSKILRPALQKALNTNTKYVFSHGRDSMIYHLLRLKAHDRHPAIAGWRSMDELHRYARVDNQILFDSDFFRKSA